MEKMERRNLFLLIVSSLLLLGTAAVLVVSFWQMNSLGKELKEKEAADKKAVQEIKAELDKLKEEIKAVEEAKKKSVLTSPETPSTPTPVSEKTRPNIVSRSVDPEVVGPSEPIVLQVELEGDADKVSMEIKGTDFQTTYWLEKVSDADDKETWTKTIPAPANPGVYRYYATAYLGSYQMSMPGVSAWSFMVEQ